MTSKSLNEEDLRSMQERNLMLIRMGIDPTEPYPGEKLGVGPRDHHVEVHRLDCTPGFDRKKRVRIIFDYDPNEECLVTRVFSMNNQTEEGK